MSGSVELTTFNTLILAFGAILVGASKSGLKGIGMLTVSLFAISFGARQSTGILLPLLIVADVFAVIYFKRFARWIYLKKFLPAMIAGVLLGVWIGKDLPEETFKSLMGIIILISVILMWWWDRKNKEIQSKDWTLAGSAGIAAGFTTMIGNLAGAFANMFFLATRMPKNEIIGTSAWLFLIINLFKLPFHIFSWETISLDVLYLDILFVPAIALGFFSGKRLVGLFSESAYRYFLLLMTAIGAVVILIK